jgi:hypothetical protein
MITFPHIGYIGRLGNQLFQYSALFSISKKHNCDFSLLDSNLELYKCFKLKTKVSPYYNKDFICVHKLGNDIITDYNTIFLTDNDQYNKILSTNFDHNFYNTNHDHKSIFGFFQNYKYFSQYENELRSQLKFRRGYNAISDLYLSQKYSGDELLSIHIRRTDYLNSSVLNNLDLSYYENALIYFDRSLPVLVFSDDPKWCQEQTLFKDDRFTIVKSNNTYIDLCLMSKCDYHIIANSSFSWWGSWLAQSKKTICPRQWFSLDYNFLDSDGLRLPNWISI